ncbi:hybrid sensor histidine kinase/response regulator [Pseudoduganella chitinolytica]|uniref:histidine kinase n=1 Tax=Pseudoduganella chitinolytica TaxID=34070 RepID=A0ABY8B6T2_9BURK|nr:PAS domain-containing protein [Pseudoduganella chitinolytica]WEF31421.1 PAS domain-containing protein [Pseudoduganella chitinolytica]
MMRAHDWGNSPLGAPQGWPVALRAVVALTLNSKFPMFIAWGQQLAFLYNDSYAEILGDKHPAALGRPFRDIWAEIWDDIWPSIDEALHGRATYHENLPLTMNRRGYEEQTWFTFSYSPVYDGEGGTAGMFCAVVETTEQVLAARHRAEEIERMRLLFQGAPGILAVLRSPSHTFEIANDAYLKLIGRTDIVGRHLADVMPEVRDQGFVALLDKVYQSGEAHVGREMPVMLQRQSGGPLEQRFVSFIFQPIRDHRGAVDGIFVEGSDVTEAVHATRALRESEQRLRQLANTIPQLAWIAAPDGDIHWFNDRWFAFTGATTTQALRGGWRDWFHPDDLPRLMAQWNRSLVSGAAYEVTARMRAADGAYRSFLIVAAPLRDAGGVIVQWFGTNTDVTPIELAQQELKEANRRKDEFLAMLAHELRNPLAPISTAAELLRRGVLDDARVRQTSAVIARQVEHMTKLVDDLLDVSRVTRGLVALREETLDFNAIAAEAVEQAGALVEARQHRLTVSLPDEAPHVLGDRTRLIQVLSNILNNAARYTPSGGRIALTVARQGREVVATVSDDGIGIPAALLPHVFDLFTQAERSPDRSQGGLGLGLALVKSLVELHGGRVSASSGGAGQGSRFEVALPTVATPDARAPAAPRDTAAHDGGQRRLMIVDDNADAAHTLALLLDAAGYAVTVCGGAAEALELAPQQAPALLFVDIGLPGMDGYQLVQRLRTLPQAAQACIVALTGYGQPEDRARALEAGFDEHLVKPVQAKAIYEVLDRVAERGAGAP